MIYWDHLCHKFGYMKKKDSNRYRREMCMLKKCLRVSRLTCAPNTCHIEQGTTLELGDVSLYPLLFGFHDKDCHAKAILQLSKTCKNNVGLTPYFFKTDSFVMMSSSSCGPVKNQSAALKLDARVQQHRCCLVTIHQARQAKQGETTMKRSPHLGNIPVTKVVLRRKMMSQQLLFIPVTKVVLRKKTMSQQFLTMSQQLISCSLA